LHMLYRGPHGWLVWLNVLLSIASAFPHLYLATFNHWLNKGDMGAFAFGPVLVFAALAKSRYAYPLCFVVLLSACVLTSMRSIPWKVRFGLAVFEMAAACVLFSDVHVIRAQHTILD
jgi:hypothetical protein